MMATGMGKRKVFSSDQSASESEANLSDSDDQSYASSGPTTRRKISPSHQRSKKRTKRDLDAVNDLSSGTTPPVLSSHAKSTHTIQSTDVASIRSTLLQWYATVSTSRNMPWRKQYDPTLDAEARAQRAYEVWISEIMLQQTQVATVIPYYVRWMEKFPTIRDLARASIDEVNALWKGLGYYSRASRLLAGAQKAVNEYGGRLPDNAKDMQANIPGIGRYSAGAICSIAYGENVPVLDGNVNRLLSRFLALHAPPKAKATLDLLWNAATAMVQNIGSSSTGRGNVVNSPSIQHPGDINQGLIELGSTVCKVRDPDCEGCPLRTWCTAYAATQTNNPPVGPSLPMPVSDIEDLCKICEPLGGRPAVTDYPMRADKKKAREELDIVNVVEWRFGSNRQFLLVRRPESGLLAGLDEFPTSPNVAAAISTARQRKIPQEILSTLLHHDVRLRDLAGKPFAPGASDTSLRITKVQPAGDVVHVFSHIKKTYRVQWVLLEGTTSLPQLMSVDVSQNNSANGAQTPSRGKGKPSKSNNVSSAMWVPLDEVTTKNIGTGVMKVWNLCKTLWE
ncbi:DNA glycosylase [Mycena crocata]|nr:DNA glycosylase [Mycena crocata]